MMINELSKLENLLSSGEWQAQAGTELWGGAGVIVKLKGTEGLTAEESGAEQTQDNGKVLIISKHAQDISGLLYVLKDIFNDYIDFASKYMFYGRLGERAKAYIAQQDDQGVLLEMINEAKLMAHELAGKLYFAYGSNMDECQMRERCPTAKLIGKARLAGYKFIINNRGVASVIENDGSYVEGLLWSVFSEDEEKLDRCEGVEFDYYRKREITVENISTGARPVAMVYIASEDTSGVPRSGYLEKIIKAANKFEFAANYRAELAEWLA